HTGIVLEDDFDLLPGNRVAVLSHIELRAGHGLLDALIERAGHRLNSTDLDGLRCRRGTCGDRRRYCQPNDCACARHGMILFRVLGVDRGWLSFASLGPMVSGRRKARFLTAL